MSLVLSVLVWTVVLVTTASSAQPAWTPVPCAAKMAEIESFRAGGASLSVAERWHAFERAVRQAQKGEAVYAPRAYPETEEEILENLEYAVREVVVGATPLDQMTSGIRQLWTDILEDELRADVVRVENWVPDRCSLQRPKPYYHLVRVFDDQRQEYARVLLHDTGLFAEVATRSSRDDSATKSWMELDDATSLLEEEFGWKGAIVDKQWVAVDGLPSCSSISPCIAFRSGGASYILMNRELLYEVATRQPMSVKEHTKRLQDAGLGSRGIHDWETPLLSIGFAWARAQRIQASP